MRRAALVALVVLTGFAARAVAQTYDTLNSALVDAVVVPAYQAYAAAAAQVPAPIEALCADPGPAPLEVAQQAWREAMLAWQRAQTIRFGPVIDDGLAPQIEFWPDKHGTAGRQMSRALAEQDPELLDAGKLEGKSVGLTSQATLERLLFGQALQDPDQGAYACAYALAVARHQADLAARLVAAWTGPDGFRAAVASAGSGNAVFFSA
jgi:predicted lipoprotein